MKLNIGCGRDIKEGWVNMDRNVYPGVDVVQDLEDTPWPGVPSQSVDTIYASHILEHTDFPKVWKEIARVLKPGGVLWAKVPCGNRLYVSNPYHLHPWTAETVRFLTRANGKMTDEPEARFQEVLIEKHRRPDGFPWWHLVHYLGLPVRGRVWEIEFVLRKKESR